MGRFDLSLRSLDWRMILATTVLTSCITAALMSFFMYKWYMSGFGVRAAQSATKMANQASRVNVGVASKSNPIQDLRINDSKSSVRPISDDDFEKVMRDVVDLLVFDELRSSLAKTIDYMATEDGNGRVLEVLTRGVLVSRSHSPSIEPMTWEGYVDDSEVNSASSFVLKSDLVANSKCTVRVDAQFAGTEWWFQPGQFVRCHGICTGGTDKTSKFVFKAKSVVPLNDNRTRPVVARDE
jgi:hypothetical protein